MRSTNSRNRNNDPTSKTASVAAVPEVRVGRGSAARRPISFKQRWQWFTPSSRVQQAAQMSRRHLMQMPTAARSSW
jgi:hypothetical protein